MTRRPVPLPVAAMSTPYRPPDTELQSAIHQPERLPLRELLQVGLAYGGCGALLSLPAVPMVYFGGHCEISDHTALVCNPLLVWGAAIATSTLVPPLVHAGLTPRLGRSQWSQGMIGAISVFIAVMGAFTIWGLMHMRRPLRDALELLPGALPGLLGVALLMSAFGWFIGGWRGARYRSRGETSPAPPPPQPPA